LISKEKLIDLYSAMVKCRIIAERAGQLARMGRLASDLGSGVGREASIAGIAIDLKPEDTLSTSPEVLISEFVRGLPIEKIFAGLARPSDCRNGTDLPNGEAALPVGTGESPLATDKSQLDGGCAAAKAHKAANNGTIAVVFCGDVQPHRGRWRRSLTLASRQNLPILFVRHLELCDGLDNAPVRRKISEAPPEALAFGVPLIQVDGNDVVAVYRVASESISRARERRGPTLIDCITDISADHFGNPQATDSRKPGGSLDPIHVMERHLAGKRLLTESMRKKIEDLFAPELDRAAESISSQSNINVARSTGVSSPFNPGPRITFIPGNDVL
jgi:TPP-dependent pyruvate/acetoin dehydrogenase alpha subunit